MELKQIFEFVCAGLILLASFFNLIAFATPGWTGNSRVHTGLWQGCTDLGLVSGCVDLPENLINAWFKGVRAMECLALIAFLASSVLAIVYIITKKEMFRIVMTVSIFVAGGLAFIGFVIYAAETKGHFYYSFGLCVLSFILAIIAGIFCLLSARQS